MRVFISIAIAFLIAAPGEASAQRNPQALSFLNQAIEAHQPTGTSLRSALRFEGTGPSPTQSLRSIGPYEPYPTSRIFIVDEKAQTSIIESVGGIAGLEFSSKTVNSPQRSFQIDLLANSYIEGTARPGFYTTVLPHTRLAGIRDTATELALSAGSDPRQVRLRYKLPNGTAGALAFDAQTKLLTKVELPPAQRIVGEESTSIAYGSYRRIDGTSVPEHYAVTVWDPVLGPQTTAWRLSSVAPADLKPDDLTPGAAKPADLSWRKPAMSSTALAPDVHLIHNVTDSKDQWSYNVLALVFEDHVAVAEAPLASAPNEKVIAKIAEIAPGKPIRHLILSHHHGDHISGVEPYIRRGTNIITTSDTETLLHRIAQSRGATFGLPRVQPVSDRLVLKDRRNEVHIYDVGQHPHSDQMLVVHLPRHDILYQVDFLNEGEYPRNRNTQALFDWAAKRGLRMKKIAGVHGRVVDAAEISSEGTSSP